MMRATLLTAITTSLLVTGLAGQERYSADREATVPVGGAQLLHISAGAGSLEVRGAPGTDAIRVNGRAWADDQDDLDDIQIRTRLRGGVVEVIAEIPDREWTDRRRGARGLDLRITVPSNLPLRIEDGSGNIEITGTASVEIEDGSGAIVIEGVTGDVRIEDGSGDLVLGRVRGDVTIVDGSGSIDVERVGGIVRIREDGSGSVRVREVEGSLTIGEKGSGSIRYTDVKGTVSIPERHRHNRRWRDHR